MPAMLLLFVKRLRLLIHTSGIIPVQFTHLGNKPSAEHRSAI